MRNKEIAEAKEAAQEALYYLNEAGKTLNSAKNWGWYDLLGGGDLISSWIKHSKMDKTADLMEQVHESLARLQKELKDVSVDLPEYETSSDMERFFDIALDNVFSDWTVQSKIKRNQAEIERLKNMVENILRKLEQDERSF